MVQEFADRNRLFEMARGANPRITIDKIDDATLRYANNQVVSRLRISGIYSPASIQETVQDFDMLQFAADCYGMEKLNYDGKVRWTTGDLLAVDEGPFKVKYQSWQPMFFFAQGDSGRFSNLLPHETWRMTGWNMVDAFTQSYFYNTEGWTGSVTILRDQYGRGKGATNINEHWRMT